MSELERLKERVKELEILQKIVPIRVLYYECSDCQKKFEDQELCREHIEAHKIE